MLPTEACAVLNDFLYYGLSQNIFERVSTHKVLEGSNSSSLSPSIRLGIVGDGSVGVKEYLDIVNQGQFSALYPDGSLIYIECTFREGRLFEHRYIFLPAPFSEECIVDRPAGVSLEDWFRLCLDEYGADCVRSAGIVRFDCVRQVDAGALDPHPVAHFTFASNNCRVPVQGPIQVRSFLDFVFDNYFRPLRPHWLGFAPQLRLRSDERTIKAEELLLHHLGWDLVD